MSKLSMLLSFFIVFAIVSNKISAQHKSSRSYLRPDSSHLSGISWHEIVRRLILLNSGEFSDSTIVKVNSDSVIINYFDERNLVRSRMMDQHSRVISESRFSQSGEFELRISWCIDGCFKAEHILYKGRLFGLSYEWNCKKKEYEFGFYFDNKRIGVWTFMTSDGSIIKSNYGDVDLIKFLPEYH